MCNINEDQQQLVRLKTFPDLLIEDMIELIASYFSITK